VVSPTSGRQERGSAEHQSASPQSTHQSAVIYVRFTAHSCEEFDASFIFDGLLEENRCVLRVCGQGTYDGRHEAVVDV